MRWTSRRNAHGSAYPKTIQSAYGIRCQVDIGTDPQKGFRLFEHGDVMACAKQRNGGGQTTDTGTSNSDIQRRHEELLLRVFVCR
ncbi:hypothetical protein D3C80_1628710 [compost metagenome]